MQFLFNMKKALAATGFVLKLHGKGMDFLNLIKILYWCDKKALIDWGRTLTGDRFVRMPQGPALWEINRLIHGDGQSNRQRQWDAHISPLQHKRNVCLKEPIGDGPLSESEMELLRQGYAMFGKLRYMALMKAVHNRQHFPEWKRPRGGASCFVEPTEILHGACKSPEQIATVEKELKHEQFMRKLLHL